MDVDVLAVGNAIVNAVTSCAVVKLPSGIRPGEAQLVDEGTLRRIEAAFRPKIIEPGGTSVNTVMHLARLGWRCLFSGEAGVDEAADMFADRFRSLGVAWVNSGGDGVTGRCLILVAPDGQPTLLTYLGAAGAPLRDSDLDHTAKVFLTEAYQFDKPHAKAVLQRRASAISCSRWLSLSSPSAAERHRAPVRELLAAGAWTVVGTYDGFCALVGIASATPIEELLQGGALLAPLFDLGVSDAYVTAGANGSWHVAHDRAITHEPALPVAPIIDLTGAGDAFLAGVLHEWLTGSAVRAQLHTGTRLAATIIQQWGTSPDGPVGT